MKNSKSRFISVVLGSYIVFLLVLLSTGTLKKYINPRLSFLTILSVLFLGAMLFYTLFRREPETHQCHHQHEHACDCGGDHGHSKVGLSSFLIFLPILLTVMVAPQTLSYPSDQRPSGTTTRSNPVMQVEPRSSDSSDSIEYDLLQIGNTLFDTEKTAKQTMINSTISVIGRVYHSSILHPDEIVIYRMIITCCAADGVPAGMVVKLPQTMNLPANGWIRVEGRMKLLPFDERLRTIEPVVNMVPPEKVYPYFVASKVNPVNPPQDEYLYP